MSGAASMTVCTNDLALCNLVEDALPIAVSDALGDAELLIPKVVELEDDKIGLAAVRAGMLAQERNEVVEAFRGDLLLSLSGLIDAAPTIGSVVLLLVRGSTRAAIVVR
jgi:hypothetical protein